MASILEKKNKDKLYRGKNVEELKNLGIREFSKFVKSRPRRTLLRNYDRVSSLIQRCNMKVSKNRPIKTHDRAMIIVPGLLGKTIGVHNGKEYLKVEIVSEMLGHRLGEFSPTRKIAKHTSMGVGASKSSMSLRK